MAPAPPIRIRPAGRADCAAVVRHRRGMFADMGFTDAAALHAMCAAAEPMLRAGLEDGSYRGWIAETEDGRVAGGGGVIFTPALPRPDDPQARKATIVNVYVEPELRRQGIARRLMAAILDACRAEGLISVYLHASDDGRPLYVALGFEPTTEMKLFLE